MQTIKLCKLRKHSTKNTILFYFLVNDSVENIRKEKK